VPKLKPVSHRELVSRLRSLGFSGLFSGGKHLFMIKKDLRLTIPNPHKGQIGIDLLVRVLRQAGVSKEEWLGIS
jgi:predicted RNA binding protein YcfA (HicA-like mRNA interferase family)